MYQHTDTDTDTAAATDTATDRGSGSQATDSIYGCADRTALRQLARASGPGARFVAVVYLYLQTWNLPDLKTKKRPNEVDPTQKQIAEGLGLMVIDVQHALRWLEAAKFLKANAPEHPAPGRSTTYTLLDTSFAKAPESKRTATRTSGLGKAKARPKAQPNGLGRSVELNGPGRSVELNGNSDEPNGLGRSRPNGLGRSEPNGPGRSPENSWKHSGERGREDSHDATASPDMTPAGSGPAVAEGEPGEVERVQDAGGFAMDVVMARRRARQTGRPVAELIAELLSELEAKRSATASRPEPAKTPTPAAEDDAQPPAIETVDEAPAAEVTVSAPALDHDEFSRQLRDTSEAVAARFGSLPLEVRAEADKRLSDLYGGLPAHWTPHHDMRGACRLVGIVRCDVEISGTQPIALMGKSPVSMEAKAGDFTLAVQAEVSAVHAAVEDRGGRHPLLPLVSAVVAGRVADHPGGPGSAQ